MAPTPTPAPPSAEAGAPSPASAVAATSSAGDECEICGGLGSSASLFFADGVANWTAFCACPVGVAAREGYEAALARAYQTIGEAAGIPERFRGLRFQTFPAEPAKAAAVERMQLVGWPGEWRGVYLHGAFGTGKTGLAVCSVSRRVLMGETGWFITAAEWLDLLRPGGPQPHGRSARSAQGFALPMGQEQAMARGVSTQLLVLDDLGAERLTGWGREQLFRLLNGRHSALLATVVTSNYSLEDLAPRLAGDADWREGERICWRIAEACDVIELVGRNLRKPT